MDEAKGIIRRPRAQNLQRLGCERWQAGLGNSEDKGERAVRDGAARQAGGGSGRALGTPLRSLNRNPEHADA